MGWTKIIFIEPVASKQCHVLFLLPVCYWDDFSETKIIEIDIRKTSSAE